MSGHHVSMASIGTDADGPLTFSACWYHPALPAILLHLWPSRLISPTLLLCNCTLVIVTPLTIKQQGYFSDDNCLRFFPNEQLVSGLTVQFKCLGDMCTSASQSLHNLSFVAQRGFKVRSGAVQASVLKSRNHPCTNPTVASNLHGFTLQ